MGKESERAWQSRIAVLAGAGGDVGRGAARGCLDSMPPPVDSTSTRPHTVLWSAQVSPTRPARPQQHARHSYLLWSKAAVQPEGEGAACVPPCLAAPRHAARPNYPRHVPQRQAMPHAVAPDAYRYCHPSTSIPNTHPPVMSGSERDTPSDAQIASKLRDVVIAIHKSGKTDDLTVKRVRARAEKELGLDDGFFKRDASWKDRSQKTIVDAVVGSSSRSNRFLI